MSRDGMAEGLSEACAIMEHAQHSGVAAAGRIEGWTYHMVQLAEQHGGSGCACAGEADCMCGKQVLPLLVEEAERLATLFKALADPTRVQLVAYFAAAPEGTVCSCDLTGALGISQPTLSHHLKTLREAGLVRREQRGRFAHFVVVPEVLAQACAFLHLEPALAPRHAGRRLMLT